MFPRQLKLRILERWKQLQLRIKPTQPNTAAHSPVEQCWYFKQLKIETERKRERWGWRRWWRWWCCRCWCWWWWWWWQWWCWWGWWWWWWWQWWTIHSSETDPTSCSHQVASVGFATNRVLAEKKPAAQKFQNHFLSEMCSVGNFWFSVKLCNVKIDLTFAEVFLEWLLQVQVSSGIC